MIYNRKHLFLKVKKVLFCASLSFSLSLSLLSLSLSLCLSVSLSPSLFSSLMNLLRVCRVSEGTLHISLHHAHSSALLLFKVALSSSPLPSPLSHAILPTCVQPVPREAPPPSLKIKLEAIYGSQQAGKALRNWIFLTEKGEGKKKKNPRSV